MLHGKTCRLWPKSNWRGGARVIKLLLHQRWWVQSILQAYFNTVIALLNWKGCFQCLNFSGTPIQKRCTSLTFGIMWDATASQTTTRMIPDIKWSVNSPAMSDVKARMDFRGTSTKGRTAMMDMVQITFCPIRSLIHPRCPTAKMLVKQTTPVRALWLGKSLLDPAIWGKIFDLTDVIKLALLTVLIAIRMTSS